MSRAAPSEIATQDVWPEIGASGRHATSCAIPCVSSDVEAKDAHGLTALMMAAGNGHLEVVRYIAGECRADVAAKVADGLRERGLHWIALVL